jgi:hypothetical protein
MNDFSLFHALRFFKFERFGRACRGGEVDGAGAPSDRALPAGSSSALASPRCAAHAGARRAAGVVLLAATMVCGSAVAAAGVAVHDTARERRVGHAFSLTTGERVYREIHRPLTQAGRLVGDRVTYRDPRDRVIARKEVDLSRRSTAPSFRLRDWRTGYIEGLQETGDGGLEMIKRDGAEASLERQRIEPMPGLVADAGFDIAVYQNLASLKNGEIFAFPFAAPGRLAVYDYRVRRVDEREVLGEPAVVIRFEPDTAILRWLVDPIDVAYHRERGTLLRYEGVSNLPNPDADGNYRVRIDFPPDGRSPRPPQPGSP